MKKFLNITKKKKKESKEEIQTRSRKNADGRISIEAESRFPAMKFRGGVDILRAKLTAERRRKCREKEPWGFCLRFVSRVADFLSATPPGWEIVFFAPKTLRGKIIRRSVARVDHYSVSETAI